MNCSASALACGFSGVFGSWRKPKYLLKAQKSWLLNGGPLSLLTGTGMPSERKVLFIFGITALALVEVTNSTSAHLGCLHTVTNRYSPVWMGPQKSTATSFQVSQSMVSCPTALSTVTHSPLGTGGSAECALPPFFPGLETTLWYTGTPWSWWYPGSLRYPEESWELRFVDLGLPALLLQPTRWKWSHTAARVLSSLAPWRIL